MSDDTEVKEAPKPISLEAINEALASTVANTTERLAKQIERLKPVTSPAASDIVAILAAIPGSPTSVNIKSPDRTSGGSYSSGTAETAWSVQISYGDFVAPSAVADDGVQRMTRDGWFGPFAQLPDDVPTGAEILHLPDASQWYRP